jgi:hypothetical protein
VKVSFDNIQAHVPVDTAKVISELAAVSGMTKSRYVGELIKEAVRRRIVFKIKLERFSEPEQKTV